LSVRRAGIARADADVAGAYLCPTRVTRGFSPLLVDMIRSWPVERPIFTAIDFVLDRSASGVARAAPSRAVMPVADTRTR
jgi:hypothetical protein